MKRIIMIIIALLALQACKEQDEWLDVKSNKADIIPSTLNDLQALLDNNTIMNANYPALGIMGSDNIFLSLNAWQGAFNAVERNSYVWATDIYQGENSSDWLNQYQKVAYANIVLEGLQKLNDQNNSAYKAIKASALFYRALAFYALAANFAEPYNQANLNKLGIILRYETDVNKIVPRSSVKETYERVLADLNTALPNLPNLQAMTTRPSKAAVYGLLARIYLAMGDYNNAYHNANEALKLYNTLINLRTLNASATYPFPTYQIKNAEIIFYATSVNYGVIATTRMQVSQELFDQYASSDLRKNIFYNSNSGGTFFKGYYTGINGGAFYGIATNELFLIRAEAAARTNKVPDAMKDLNDLLRTRWLTAASYADLSASTELEALQHILRERRKELPFTASIRWEDLRRLNTDSRFAITLNRELNGKTYTLPPNDKRYVYPIPDNEVKLNGTEQNER
ncbi:RagB/SusD family nutrient uptake outer membrane protein [Flavobacterium lindanitolerans]|uniref:RagB/SusD family nutrient uptake outer membrane protein n=1 Tax=Flavobacterium lindanitolerans TaxID=428988 RepID=UPI0027B8E8BC|nr:RagB/SusD family nutrient uptake outer membrane protein [Flavobacterium lindanitolerans]